MALISLRQLLDHAAEYEYGVPAFNVNNLEQTRAIMEAADASAASTCPIFVNSIMHMVRRCRTSVLLTPPSFALLRVVSTNIKHYVEIVVGLRFLGVP